MRLGALAINPGVRLVQVVVVFFNAMALGHQRGQSEQTLSPKTDIKLWLRAL